MLLLFCPYIFSIISLQAITVFIQPGLCLLVVWAVGIEQSFKLYCMFHDQCMTEFMNDDVINHEIWRLDNAPIDRNVLVCRTITPFLFLTTYKQPIEWEQQLF
jgi:hypothetical protein